MARQYLRFFLWHIVRYVARHRLLALLNVVSVALGVAVFLAIQIANQSARQSFEATIDLVAGKAQLQVIKPAGGLREEIFPLLARAPGVAAATPLVRGIVTLPDFPGEYLQVLGLDVFTNESFRTFELTDFGAGDFDVQRWLGEPNTLAISDEFARAHELKGGSVMRAQVNGAEHQLRVGFVLKTKDAVAVDPHFAVIDIGWAQELFARRRLLSSVQLQLEPGQDRENIMEHLRAMLPPDTRVETPAQRSGEVEKLLAGFHLNLTAMSLVSLLVGMFLIYNTVSASVVRRRSEIGILRSLGASRGEVRALFLGEAAILGAVGALFGLGGGVVLAQALVGTVSKTISSLYVLLSVRSLAFAPSTFAFAFVLGIVSVLIAAWLPANAAAKMDPVQALRSGSIVEQSIRLSSSWFWTALALLVGAGIFSLLALTSGPPWMGFGGAFCVLIGFSFLVPNAALRFSRLRFGAARLAQLAASNLGRSLLRNSVTIAALAAAVAMAIATTVMVFSFRQTITSWIDQTLVADLFIGPASNEIAGASFMPLAAIAFLENHSAVAAVDTFREIDVPMGEATVALAVVRGNGRREFQFVRGNRHEIMQRLRGESCVLVSESFSRRHGVREGQNLNLTTPQGSRSFPIAGVFYDYTRDQGVVFMSEKTFQPFWNDERVNSVAVYLKPGASKEKLSADFRAEFSRAGEFMVLSNRELRARVFEIFDQTFAVTQVLRSIAVIIAIVGICLGLTTLIAERTRELGIFRALGGSGAQLRRVLLWESGMIGLLAAVIGMASGICLSLVLTGVINRAFFGWTIQLAIPWSSLALTPFWIVGAAILAGIWPAWRASQLNLAEVLREE